MVVIPPSSFTAGAVLSALLARRGLAYVQGLPAPGWRVVRALRRLPYRRFREVR